MDSSTSFYLLHSYENDSNATLNRNFSFLKEEARTERRKLVDPDFQATCCLLYLSIPAKSPYCLPMGNWPGARQILANKDQSLAGLLVICRRVFAKDVVISDQWQRFAKIINVPGMTKICA